VIRSWTDRPDRTPCRQGSFWPSLYGRRKHSGGRSHGGGLGPASASVL